MKNLFLAFASVFMIAAFASCGDDDDSTSCEQSNFVGTYTLVGDSICTTDNTITAPTSFFLTAGSSTNIVLENGEEDLELTITDCDAMDDFVTYSIDGDNLVSKIGECEWSYKKN